MDQHLGVGRVEADGAPDEADDGTVGTLLHREKSVHGSYLVVKGVSPSGGQAESMLVISEQLAAGSQRRGIGQSVRVRRSSAGGGRRNEGVLTTLGPADDSSDWGVGGVTGSVKSSLGSSSGTREESADGSIKRATLMSSPLASSTSQQARKKRILEWARLLGTTNLFC
jgi:hypothetical protein